MGLLFGQFESACLINLPERTDRRRQSERALKRVGWADEVTIVPASKFDSRDTFRSAGERGCFHSHLRCLKTFAMSGQSGIVLEDDIAFAPLRVLSASIAETLCRSNWDLVYFGHEGTGYIPRATDSVFFVPYPHDSGILTAHFYGVHHRVAPRLVEFLEQLLSRPFGHPLGGPMAFDGALSTFRKKNPDIRTLIANPKLGWQRSSRSDLSPGKIDRVFALRPFLAAARGLKNALR